MFKALQIWKYASCSRALQDSKENTRSLVRAFIVNDISNFNSAFQPLDCPRLPENLDLGSKQYFFSLEVTWLKTAPPFFAAHQAIPLLKAGSERASLKSVWGNAGNIPGNPHHHTLTVFNMRHHIFSQTLSLDFLSSSRCLLSPRVGSRNNTNKVVIGQHIRMASMKAANRLKVAFEKNVGPSMGCW
jgi:hypothetical protein